MSTDDRTETITDPAEIRATDEPDERTPNEVHVDESGCSCKTGPYRGFQRDPIDAACPKHGGPLRHGDGDVTVCHPDGSTTIIREPDERGDFPCCATPAPVGAGLDLDAVHETICDNFTGMAEVRQAADALVAEVRSLRANWRMVTTALGYGDGITEPQIEHRDFVAECERQFAEASEWRESQRWRDECHDAGHPDDEDCYEHDPALVLLTLRAKLTAVEAELAELRHWTRRDRPRLIAATALAFSRPMILGDFDIRASDLRAALATTGEDQ